MRFDIIHNAKLNSSMNEEQETLETWPNIDELLGRNPSSNKENKFGTLTMILLSIGKILVCHGFFWSKGLVVGTIPFFINTILWGMSSIFLCLCIAEMASALPFTGGIYGFVRGIIGPYLGFFVGVFEICCGLLLIGMYVVAFSYCVNSALGLPLSYQIIFYPVPYLLSVFLQFSNQRYFVQAVIGLTLLGLLFFAIYVIGGLAHLNQNRYGNLPNAEPESTHVEIFKYFYNSSYALFLFWGIETIPVVSSEAAQPNKSIPLSVITATAFANFAAMAVVLLAAWQHPGPKTLAQDYLPLRYGYASIFHTSIDVGNIFMVPATLTAVVMSIHFLCTIVRSMSQSGLLPSYFNRTMKGGQVPYVALSAVISGSVIITLVHAAAIIWLPVAAPTVVIMFQYCHYFNYMCIYAAYLLFLNQYGGREHSFRSPLGKYGAYAGIVGTLLMLLLNVFPFYDYMGVSLAGFVGLYAIATVSYIFYASGNQRFSPEEERVFFIAYIIRANRRRRNLLKKRNTSSHMESSCSVHTPTGSRCNASIRINSPKSCINRQSSNSGSFRVIPIVTSNKSANRILPTLKELQSHDGEEVAMTGRKDLVPDQSVNSFKKLKPTASTDTKHSPQRSFSSLATTSISITRRIFGSPKCSNSNTDTTTTTITTTTTTTTTTTNNNNNKDNSDNNLFTRTDSRQDVNTIAGCKSENAASIEDADAVRAFYV